MIQPPRHDKGGQNQQAECLVATVDALLFGTAGRFGSLLQMRFDSGLHHGFG
jgi:hypothetical protein